MNTLYRICKNVILNNYENIEQLPLPKSVLKDLISYRNIKALEKKHSYLYFYYSKSEVERIVNMSEEEINKELAKIDSEFDLSWPYTQDDWPYCNAEECRAEVMCDVRRLLAKKAI